MSDINEGISRRRIAIKNAQKQRWRYTQRKGELPPIMNKPKSRISFTDKEVNNLKSLVQKQAEKRKEARSITKDKRHPQMPAKSNVPAIAASSKTAITAPENQPVHKPAFQPRRPEPKPMGGDVNDHISRYADTNDPKHLDHAKRAASQQYASDLTFAQTEYKTDEFKKRGKAEAKQKYKDNLNMIKDVKYPPGSGLLNKIRRIFAEEQLDEGKWGYPKDITKTRETSDMGTTNAADNRKRRKELRKKIKAKQHKELMQGKKLDETKYWPDKTNKWVEGEKERLAQQKKDIVGPNKATRSLKNIGDKMVAKLKVDMEAHKALVAKNKAANPEKYEKRPNSPANWRGLNEGAGHDEEVNESVSGQLRRLKNWVTGRSRAKAKAAEWAKKADDLSHESGRLAAAHRNARAESNRSKKEGDPIHSEFFKRKAELTGKASSRKANQAIRLKNAAWDATHNHEIIKFGRALKEACSKRVNPKEVLDDAEYKKMKKDKKNPALRKALGKKK